MARAMPSWMQAIFCMMVFFAVNADATAGVGQDAGKLLRCHLRLPPDCDRDHRNGRHVLSRPDRVNTSPSVKPVNTRYRMCAARPFGVHRISAVPISWTPLVQPVHANT